MLFNVTYQTDTPESAEVGDFADTGFELENCTLREAMKYMCGEGGIEANESPCESPRWITAYKVDYSYETEEETSYSLHFPDAMTPASRLRLCRLLGVYGA